MTEQRWTAEQLAQIEREADMLGAKLRPLPIADQPAAQVGGMKQMTSEQIKMLQGLLIIDSCEIQCQTPEAPICRCNKEIKTLCDLALDGLRFRKLKKAQP